MLYVYIHHKYWGYKFCCCLIGLDSSFLIDKLHEIHFKQKKKFMTHPGCGHSVNIVLHFQIHFTKVIALEAIICLLTSSPWLIESQLDQFSTRHAMLIIMVHEGCACFNIHLCCSSSQRGTKTVFCCWSGKYKQWSIVTISDQLALCLWILQPTEIVCSTPQDVL